MFRFSTYNSSKLLYPYLCVTKDFRFKYFVSVNIAGNLFSHIIIIIIIVIIIISIIVVITVTSDFF